MTARNTVRNDELHDQIENIKKALRATLDVVLDNPDLDNELTLITLIGKLRQVKRRYDEQGHNEDNKSS